MNINKEIEQAKQLLKNNGFYVENLWHIDDVKYGANSEEKYFECTNNKAYNILNEAIEQDYIHNNINENIEMIIYRERKKLNKLTLTN
tara:strand:- start:539 stop:802 length:264 start_codon:yes stop_codon:yes gene_type:complete